MATGEGKLKFKNDDKDETREKKGKAVDLGLSLDKLNLGPKKKLLVLSINGLLIDRAFRHDKAQIPKNRQPDAQYGNHLVFKRPYSDEFMKFCFERFEVGIWSSAMEQNIDGILDCAMKGLKRKLAFIWDQRQCTDSGFMSLEKKTKPLYLKELKKLWGKHDRKLPWRRQRQYSSSDTLLIDDKPYKSLLNPAYTAIFPEPYNAEDVNDVALEPKGELWMYLEGIADARDVTEYVEEHPFGQPPISPSHSDWEFYSKIIRRFEKKNDEQ